MRRIVGLLKVALATAALLVVMAVPAFAGGNANHAIHVNDHTAQGGGDDTVTETNGDCGGNVTTGDISGCNVTGGGSGGGGGGGGGKPPK